MPGNTRSAGAHYETSTALDRPRGGPAFHDLGVLPVPPGSAFLWVDVTLGPDFLYMLVPGNVSFPSAAKRAFLCRVMVTVVEASSIGSR